MVLAAPARDSRLALHYGLAALAAFGLVTEVPVHVGMRCNSGRSETLARRPRRLSPETLNVFSVPPLLNTQYRRRIRELARAGRSIKELAREFEPMAETIRQWIKQTTLDDGLRNDGLTTSEREELNRLRRENRVLREEREILAKAATCGRHCGRCLSQAHGRRLAAQ
jgi:transposase